jgi:hypothetical protein
MPLKRLVFLLTAVFAALIAVVVLRGETTRLHYQLSQLDRRAEVLRQELREKELELVRLRNPALIRRKLDELRAPAEETAEAKTPGGRPEDP